MVVFIGDIGAEVGTEVGAGLGRVAGAWRARGGR